MADSELIVRLRGENADLKSKLKEVTNASKTSASGMASAFKSSLGSIASAIGVTFSVAAVVNFTKQSVQAFMESERAAVSLKNAIGNLGGSDIQRDCRIWSIPWSRCRDTMTRTSQRH